MEIMKDIYLELEKLNQRLGEVKTKIKIAELEDEKMGFAINEISLEFYREEEKKLIEKIKILNEAQEVLLGIR